MKRNALFTPGGVSWGVVALGLALVLLGMRFALPDVFFSAVAPVARTGTALTGYVGTLLAGFRDVATLSKQKDALVDENTALAAENHALSARLADLTSLGVEAGDLVAGVLARPPVSPYDTLIIDQGSGSGVRSGMEAFGAGGVPLGVVTSVTERFARVTLFSAPATSVAGWVGADRTPLSLTGEGGGVLTANVPRAAGILAGDIVYVPGPGALPVGSVTRVDSDPSSPVVTLRITPVRNPFTVTWVTLREGGASLGGAVNIATSTLP